MTIQSQQESIEALARDVLRFVDDRRWDRACGNYRIYSSMVSSEWWLEYSGQKISTGGISPTMQESKETSAALRFLQKEMLEASNCRVWGVAFTLDSNGKFHIDFDYNKPEGYEESDETISGDEINESLARLAGKDDASS